jgi:hypothetical protein
MGWICLPPLGIVKGAQVVREIRVAVVEDGSEEEFLSVVPRGIQI